jgi:Na+-driven multidrug efflux pump
VAKGEQAADLTMGSPGIYLPAFVLNMAASVLLGYSAAGAWVAMISSMTVQGLLMTLRFHRGRGKELKVD